MEDKDLLGFPVLWFKITVVKKGAFCVEERHFSPSNCERKIRLRKKQSAVGLPYKNVSARKPLNIMHAEVI
jgi:hypothetical protein